MGKVYAITDVSKFRGYSVQAKSMGQHLSSKGHELEEVKFDSETKNEKVEELKNAIKNNEEVSIVISGPSHLKEFEEMVSSINTEIPSKNYQPKNVKVYFVSDRIGDSYEPLPSFYNSSTLSKFDFISVMPKVENDSFKQKIEQISNSDNVAFLNADLASINPKTIGENSNKFKNANGSIVSFLEENYQDGKNPLTLSFIGGRLETSPGEWQNLSNNSVKSFINSTFEKANGGDIILATHGLRTFTRVDKKKEEGSLEEKSIQSLDFKPINYAYELAKQKLKPGQILYVFSAEQIDEKNKKPIFKIIAKNTSDEIIEGDVDLKKNFDKDEKPIGGDNPYHYFLEMANKNFVKNIVFSPEQMNFPAEVIAAGGGQEEALQSGLINKISYDEGWQEATKNNKTIHNHNINQIKNGEKLLTPNEAVDEYLESTQERPKKTERINLKRASISR